MKISNTLYVANRDDWRSWLVKNHDIENEVWLIYYKKHTEKDSIPYDDAVEEAICFGWIDSRIRKIDEERYAQKFSPRIEKSKWSQLNIRRARKMIQEGKMTDAGLAKFEVRVEYEEPPVPDLEMPSDLKNALNKNKKAIENFNNFPPSYRKQYISWVITAKREETRKRRIQRIVKFSEQNKKGMM